ncbi:MULTISPECIES: dipicolinate synthase subunit B [Allobacillus]|uniref:Dipicolinate synthase subunit B n=1 Tax=Allobacillus halotolerans TaxID=570278 RepID=A0ABS6GPT8_9BACI|nr:MULTISPECIES: dipicolinate synthase subunit B [Allobacillus]MBU6081088.1 dipicolinate synthase subunit B [Allobacillus halotolerans]TSJ69175.1 dipicolinate synthase subunit B [Allobacillus sp. SKP2-8]
MDLKGKRIGFGLTGSHCTYEQVFPQIEKLMELGAEVVPIVSYTVQETDTKFGNAKDHLERIKQITGKELVKTMPEAEPLGPQAPLDCMIIAPLTGNSLSKFANALTNTPPLMAAKATLRNGSPVVLAIATNDALGLNAMNLGKLLVTKNVFFVPYGQDHPYKKPDSLVSHMELIPETIDEAINGKQLQPIMRNYDIV